MSLNDSFDIFPVLKTKNIVIGNNKVTVRFSLSTKDRSNVSSWLGSSRFKAYIKIYFVLTPDTRRTAFLNDPDTRFPNTATQRGLRMEFPYMIETSFADVYQSDAVASISEVDLSAGGIVNDIFHEVEIDELRRIFR